jgi:hypothetical protein
MSKSIYGWANRATWNISMVYEETFRCICEEQADQFDDVEDVADAFKSIVEELELQPLEKITGLAYELVSEMLNRVDWMELAEHFGEEMIEKQLRAEEEERKEIKGLSVLLAEAEEEDERLNNYTVVVD